MMKNTIKTTYRLINLSDDKVMTFSAAYVEELAMFLLCRNVSNYVVLKTDDLGTRMVPVSAASVQDCVDSLRERIG